MTAPAPQCQPMTDEALAGWARNWHWNDTAEDKPVDPSIYFRDMRMLKAFLELDSHASLKAQVKAGAERIEELKDLVAILMTYFPEGTRLTILKETFDRIRAALPPIPGEVGR